MRLKVKFIQFLIDIYGIFDDYKERKVSICIYENFSEDIFEVKKKLIVDKYIGYGETFKIEKVFENTKENPKLQQIIYPKPPLSYFTATVSP